MSTDCLLPWAPTSSGDFPKTQHPQKSPTRSSSSFTCEPLLTCFKTVVNVSQPGARPWAKIFIIMTSGEPHELHSVSKAGPGVGQILCFTGKENSERRCHSHSWHDQYVAEQNWDHSPSLLLLTDKILHYVFPFYLSFIGGSQDSLSKTSWLASLEASCFAEIHLAEVGRWKERGHREKAFNPKHFIPSVCKTGNWVLEEPCVLPSWQNGNSRTTCSGALTLLFPPNFGSGSYCPSWVRPSQSVHREFLHQLPSCGLGPKTLLFNPTCFPLTRNSHWSLQACQGLFWYFSSTLKEKKKMSGSE